MKKELIIKKCPKCQAIVKIINDCHCENCGIKCCDMMMEEIKANSTEASVEKHKPNYKFENDKLIVSVNHVMEDNHFIEWICLVTDKKEEYVYFDKNDIPTATFNKTDSGIIYSYCNLHGLWKEEIK